MQAHENPASALDRPLAAVESPIPPPAEGSPAGPEAGETGHYRDTGEDVGSIVAGKYKLLEAIGQGGMGDVFMAQQTVTLGHDGFAVTQANLSPDGQSVLSLGRDGTARLWDSATGKQRAILGQPPHRLKGYSAGRIQFSKDGSTALTLHGDRVYMGADSPLLRNDGIVRLWDVATSQLRAAISKNVGNIEEVQLSRNNSRLVTACTPVQGIARNPNHVLRWNARTGQLIRKLEFPGPDPSIDVSPDGRSGSASPGSLCGSPCHTSEA